MKNCSNCTPGIGASVRDNHVLADNLVPSPFQQHHKRISEGAEIRPANRSLLVIVKIAKYCFNKLPLVAVLVMIL